MPSKNRRSAAVNVVFSNSTSVNVSRFWSFVHWTKDETLPWSIAISFSVLTACSPTAYLLYLIATFCSMDFAKSYFSRLYNINPLFKADLAKKGLVWKIVISLSYVAIAFSFSSSRL